jgi:L-ascorbate metabolism protein UlaG (beta-lactamase superfamily)
VEELSEGETAYVSGVEIKAVPALHDGRRYPFGKQIAALGYAVAGSRTLYFAGDTDFFEEMSELAGLDAVLLPIAGWGARLGPGHLDPAGAAEALRVLRPRLAIPIHWGTYAPWHWRLTRHETSSREPEVAFADAATLVAPDVEVRILRPGERTEF